MDVSSTGRIPVPARSPWSRGKRTINTDRTALKGDRPARGPPAGPGLQRRKRSPPRITSIVAAGTSLDKSTDSVSLSR